LSGHVEMSCRTAGLIYANIQSVNSRLLVRRNEGTKSKFAATNVWYVQRTQRSSLCLYTSHGRELDPSMDWFGLVWVGLAWIEFLQFMVGWLGL